MRIDPDRSQLNARVHIVGASGSGTTTLGRALSHRLGCAHFDTDDFYWMPSDPPFEQKRPIDERLRLLSKAIDDASSWVLSGSLSGWGDPLITRFTHVVFITLEPTIRIERLRAREQARYGADRIAIGGDLHDAYRAFMSWAIAYDSAGLEQRSRLLHEEWLQRLPRHVALMRVNSAEPVDDLVAQVAASVAR